jgi:hypothetical protein
MGVYWRYVNEDEKQYIDLAKVGHGGVKMTAAVWDGPLLAWLMLQDWYGDRVGIVGDEGDHPAWQAGYEDNGWTDVTAYMLRKLRESMPYLWEKGGPWYVEDPKDDVCLGCGAEREYHESKPGESYPCAAPRYLRDEPVAR